MQLFSNNGLTLLQQTVAIGDLTLSVIPGTGNLFPNPGQNQFFLVTLENQTAIDREIVKVTARSGDIFTIERAQEGTTDQEWSVNDIVDCRNTAQTMVTLQDVSNDPFSMEVTTGNVTRIFTSEPFETKSTRLYLGGMRQSLGNDYIEENSTTLQLLNPPLETDILNGCNIVLDYSRRYLG